MISSNQGFSDSESDVVGREKAADKVLEQKLELHRRLNLTPSMLSVIEPDGRYIWMNDVVLQYFGLSAADITSGDLRRRVVHPDDFQRVREERQRSLASGAPFEYENRLRRHDGQYRWFLIRYQPLKDATGRVVRWYGSAIDIEDRKRAEEAVRRSQAYLVEAQRMSHTGSWAINLLTREIIHSSEEHSRLYGFDPGKGTPSLEEFLERIHPEDRTQVLHALESASRARKDFALYHRVVLPDGTTKYLYGTAHPVFNSSADVTEFMGIIMDITERKLAEEEREKLRRLETDMIRALNEQMIKGQKEERIRIAGELHDGVLQKITSLALELATATIELPADSEPKAEVREVEKKLIQVGAEIRQLSHELHPAVLQEAGLPAALSSYCEEFGKLRGIPIAYQADESVAELSPGAALCIYRIAQEALGNVAKHARAKQVEIRLTRSDSRVCLVVADDGVGFNPDGSGKAGGLGLINMRERVRQLNGTFEFKSEPGRGTTVKAEVPFRPVP